MLFTPTPVSVIGHQGFTGPVLNYFTSPQSIIDKSMRSVVPAGLLQVGIRIRISALLDLWCVAAPQVSFTFQVMLGSNIAFSSGPVLCLPTQFSNFPSRISFDLRVDAEGSPNKGVLTGYFTAVGAMFAPVPEPIPVPYSSPFPSAFPSSQVLSGRSGAFPRLSGQSGWIVGNQIQPSFPRPAGARSPVPIFPNIIPNPGSFDTGSSLALDLWCGCSASDIDNAVQLNDYLVEAMSPMPSITVPDSAKVPV